MRFLLVNRILHMEPGLSIEAEMTLPASEELFQDHFPGFPVVPGVLLTEMMAQAAGKCLNAQRATQHPERGYAMLGEIRSAKFRSWVRPGDIIGLQARIETLRDAFAIARCTASVQQKKVCSAELLFSFLPAAQFATNYHDQLLEDWLQEHAKR
jgi:3-hydroxyacyl-[acyl-carrier-protein] dehydratase